MAENKKQLPPSREKMTLGKPAKKTIPGVLRKTFVKKDFLDVLNYVVHDVGIPAFTDAMVNMVTRGANLLFKGEASPYNNGYSSGQYNSNGAVGNSRVDYGRPYRQSSYGNSYNESYYPRGSMRYVDVVVDRRDVAEDILRAIEQDTIDYGMVPVRELYEMVGMRWTSEDNDYGWSDVSSARIVSSRDGWKIMMPTPEFLGVS